MEQLSAPGGEEEYRTAFTSVRFAKNCFWWLILLAIVVQLAGFILVRFVDVIPQPLTKAEAATQPAAGGQAPATAPAEAEHHGTWRGALSWVLGGTKFLGLAAGMLLALTLLLATLLSLVGHTGGVGGFIGAFFTSLFLWAFLVPWQQVGGFTFASGALFNLGELLARTDETLGAGASWLTRALYYVRFAAYPLLVLILLLVVQAKFARGHRRMMLGVARPEAPEEKM